MSHKPHHRFTNPRLFDAFNGSATDTFLMILVPLFLTSRLVHCNVWSYMAFGSLYANWLTLIHAEYSHPWDPLFRKLGLGTAADHHVHHKLFKFNYGHTFMYVSCISRKFIDCQFVIISSILSSVDFYLSCLFATLTHSCLLYTLTLSISQTLHALSLQVLG